jgi:hypothetical protein
MGNNEGPRRLRISGFGACMIAGYPFGDRGFFQIACSLIEHDDVYSIEPRITTLGGFPVTRVEKYLERVLGQPKPDYIVFQFGATDASCASVKSLWESSASRPKPFSSRSASSIGKSRAGPSAPRSGDLTREANSLTAIRWMASSAAGFFVRPKSTTPFDDYIRNDAQHD